MAKSQANKTRPVVAAANLRGKHAVATVILWRKPDVAAVLLRGQPADALPNLFKQWNTTYLSFEEDPEPYGRVRDQNIMAMCKEMGIKVVTEKSHTLYDLNKYTFWTTFIISKLTSLQFLIIG